MQQRQEGNSHTTAARGPKAARSQAAALPLEISGGTGLGERSARVDLHTVLNAELAA